MPTPIPGLRPGWAAVALAAVLPTAAAAQAPELRQLRALFVIDTNSNLSDSVKRDRARMERLLLSSFPRDRLELTVMTGNDVTKESILRHYAQLPTGPTEALLFYYAGHGAFDVNRGHFLYLQEGKAGLLYRDDLRTAMQKKSPGLTVLLTDCCSSLVKVKSKKRRIEEEEPPASVRTVSPTLGALFLRSRGVVDVTAATDNEAYGDDEEGGIFTRTFARLATSEEWARKARAGTAAWKDFFPQLRGDTESTFAGWASKHRSLGESVDQKVQRPRAFAIPGVTVEAGPPASTSGEVRMVNELGAPLTYQYRWQADEPWQEARLESRGSRSHRPPGAGRAPRLMSVKFASGKTAELKPGNIYRLGGKKKRGLNDDGGEPLSPE
jgi:hypothetical protein